MLRCALEVLERDIKHRNHKKPDRAAIIPAETAVPTLVAAASGSA
jgi:hypothetical protein